MHTDDGMHNAIEKKLSSILHRRHRVLILLPPSEERLIQNIAGAVERCGCVSVIPGEDYRWKTLLRLAFVERTETVIGAAQLILGLLKVARATNTPLFIHDILLCEEAKPWLRDDLKQSLDCRVWNLELQPQHQLGTHNYTQSVHTKHEDQLLICPNVLDFSMRITECGTSLEVVMLDNQKVGGLPSCAKLLLRKWEPETDVPFSAKKQ